MSAFSFTAPAITEEQEQVEREAFSDKEREQIRKDLYGGEEPVIEETAEMKLKGVTLLRESLEQIPPNEKAEYMEALERCPALVERESSPLAFLRWAQYDAWAAARRVIEYWRVRLITFGPERAFLPMTMDGAMQDEVEHLNKGILQVLPDDESDRAVLFLDRIRAIRAVIPKPSIYRVFFYLLQVTLERESPQKNGCVFSVNVRGFDLYTHFDRIQTKRMLEIGWSMPLAIRGVHCCTGSGKSVVSLILPVGKHISGKHIRHRLVIHAGSDSELVDGMKLYGLERGSIPKMLGGTFARADFEDWVRERRAVERRRARNPQQVD